MKMFKRLFLLAALLGSTLAAMAQSTMTDVQVLDYVKAGIEQGKTQNELLRELVVRGVDRAQAERVKKLYDSQQTAVAQAVSGSDDRSHIVQGEVDFAPADFQDTENGPMVYGRDIFRNRELNFAPSENLATPKNYHLGPGDEVIIDIFGANQTTLRSVISPEGSINVDILGPVYLSGMTIEEANKYLKRKLAGIYGGLNRSSDGTDIRLSLGQIRSIQVNVLGDVQHAGTYMVPAFSTVFHVLYLAGGVVEPGSLREIVVNRAGKIVGTVDVYDFLVKGSRERDIRLEEGDVVLVRPYTCMVKIGGKVKRPMSFELKAGETLEDLLAYAGGFASGAFTESVTVVRQNGKNYEVRTVEAPRFRSFEMQDGDEVTVSELNSYYENRVSVSGAVYQAGTYELGGDVKTVRQLVSKAGGLLPDAFLNLAVLHRQHDEDKSFEVISVNLGRVLSGADPDIVLQKNDELFITSRADIQEQATMSIYGMVTNPGVFPYARNTTVEDLIIMAGGLREGASLARVDIARRKRDAQGLVSDERLGEIISVRLRDGFVDDGGAKVYLEPYDEVTVHRSPAYTSQTHVTVTGEANFAGDFTLTNRGERLSDIVRKAGGTTNYAYLAGARLYRNMTDDEREQLLKVLEYRGVQNATLDSTGLDTIASRYQVAIRLDQALANPGSRYDIEVVEGDVLDIPLIRNTVRVIGSVMMPSVLTYEPGKNGAGYIEACGGYLTGAKRSKAYVIHMNGNSEKLRGGTRIQPGDQIVVPAKIKREGAAGETLARVASMATTVASLGTTMASLFMIIQRNKSNN